MAPTQTDVWMDANGTLVCPQHAGSYLKFAIQASPKAVRHITPITIWEKLTPPEIKELRGLRVPLCFDCPQETTTYTGDAAPHFGQPISWKNDKERSMFTLWVSDVPDHTKTSELYRAVLVWSGHQKHYKQYYVKASIVSAPEDGSYYSRLYGMQSKRDPAEYLLKEDTNRYSAKRLAHLHAINTLNFDVDEFYATHELDKFRT
jgi:hypothetical protein